MPEAAVSVAAVRGHLKAAIYRRAYALILSSATTAVLGLLYWTLAARLYGARDVGINAALISTMMFLSYVSQLSLAAALPRFIPTAGRETPRLIFGASAISLVLSAALASVFLLGCGTWAPQVLPLVDSPVSATWFVLATMTWSLFALQDAALTGLSRASWVPVKNTLFAIGKIVLLVALVGSMAASGVWLSWTVPAIIAIVPVNVLILRHFLPAHLAVHGEAEPEGSIGVLARYVASDFGGSLLVAGATSLLPLVVLATAGPSASAYYYVAWTLVYSLQIFSLNIAISLSVEGARERASVGLSVRRMLRLLLGLQLPLVLGAVVFAPWILRFFGSAYSNEGALLLQLLALGVLPHGINAVYLGLARVRRQFKQLFAVQAAQALLFVALAVPLLSSYGIAGVGGAFLVGQSAVALPVLVLEILPLLRMQGAAAGTVTPGSLAEAERLGLEGPNS